MNRGKGGKRHGKERAFLYTGDGVFYFTPIHFSVKLRILFLCSRLTQKY